MKNKVLVKIIVPEINESFDIGTLSEPGDESTVFTDTEMYTNPITDVRNEQVSSDNENESLASIKDSPGTKSVVSSLTIVSQQEPNQANNDPSVVSSESLASDTRFNREHDAKDIDIEDDFSFHSRKVSSRKPINDEEEDNDDDSNETLKSKESDKNHRPKFETDSKDEIEELNSF